MSALQENNGTKDVRVFTPTSTEDCFEIIIFLRENPAIINFNGLNAKLKQRIIDVLCGASTALSMGVCMVDKNNLLIIKK
ncbi:MAG: cell division protein SepF [Clostridia bacterium]|nr:cell division protein SepF [Clostridia bacterium]